MARLIDANAAYAALKHEEETHGLSFTAEAFGKAARIIDQMPTIEAEPVKPALSDDDRKASEAWCENCDHIEMCKWYPTCGCEFRQIGGKPAGRAESEVQE